MTAKKIPPSQGRRFLHLVGLWVAVVGSLLLQEIPAEAAAIISIPSEFTGDKVESFESFAIDSGEGSPLPILGGDAIISGGGGVWPSSPSFDEGWGLGPFTAKAADGVQLFGTTFAGTVSYISFARPVIDIGAFWGDSFGYSPTITFGFYGESGVPIGTSSFDYSAPNNDGTLEWQGWHSAMPIYSMTIFGQFVASDSLRVNFIPEPGAQSLLLCGAAIFGLGVRKCSSSKT